MELAQGITTLIETYGRDAVAAAIGALLSKECKRCNHTWTPRAAGMPSQCPRCKSTLWAVPRQGV